jgi:putative ABC transport system substrate-binding protein
MRRREFIALLGAAAAFPVAAHAQQTVMPVVGFLGASPSYVFADGVTAFDEGLAESGYIKGKNLAIAYRWAQSPLDDLPALAGDLVGRKVAVLFAAGSTAALAAKAATTTIPIVFTMGGDPVHLGLVTSLSRPGGNITGASRSSHALGAKLLELLNEMVPRAKTVGLLVNPRNPSTEADTKEIEEAARNVGQRIIVVTAENDGGIAPAFAEFAQRGADALLIGNDPFFLTSREAIVAAAAHHAIPAVYSFRDFVEAGGLASYAANLADLFRKAGVYTGRILKGAKPADLPIQLPTRFELVINLKTARALGLAIKPSFLARAEEVIE